MTGFLIDTSVLSELAPGRTAPRAATWFRENEGSLFLPVVVLSEVRQGIARLQRIGAHRKLAELSAWFDETLESFARDLLPVSVAIALVAGDLSDRANARGANPGFPDILIAATASCHGLSVATRNLRHFEPLGVSCLDPFAGAD